MIYIKDNKYLNLPEQVQQNIEDITALAAAQDDDHDAINTNTNDINTLKGQMTSVESITLKGDETNNKAQLYRSNKADMGSIQFKTVNGVSLIGKGDIPIGGSSYTAGDGILIENDTISVSNMIEKEVTYATNINVEGHIKTPQISNLNGNALVRYKDTENVSVFGGVNSKAVIMGSEDRPYYSKDGSDFTGVELALKSDITSGGSSLPDDPTTDGDYALVNNVSSGESTHSWGGVEVVDMVELPAVPTSEDGTYVLKAVVASGAVTYSWVKE